MSKLSKFFANSHKKFKTQLRNRCKICGRSRGFLRAFSLCRICVRTLCSNGGIPGFFKSSW